MASQKLACKVDMKHKWLIAFCLCFLPGLSLAGPCEEVAFSDPESFTQAMTEGLVLREGQDSLMKLYLTSKTPYPNLAWDLSLSDVLVVLNHYPGLSKPLLRERILAFPVTKRENLESPVNVTDQPFVVKGIKTFRLRSLSLQESPFRSCLGGDCATLDYFRHALDPNFFYFTLTDKDYRSSGAIAVVLGTAENPQGQRVKVAFVDKIQGVQTDRVQAMLEGIRLILKEEGYILGLPEQVGGVLKGISSDHVLQNYMEYEVLPKLSNSFKNFSPHENEYRRDMPPNEYSRAEDQLPLLEFEALSLQGVQIKPGALPKPKLMRADLNIQSLYEPILSLRESKKEMDQLKFLSHLLNMRILEILNISDQYIKEHLDFVMQNPDFSFKVRKQAFWTMLKFLRNRINPKGPDIFDIESLQDKTLVFSEKERQILIGEMSNWKNTRDWRFDFIRTVNLRIPYFALDGLLDSPWGRLVDKDLLLVYFAEGGKMEAVSLLLKAGADVNAKDKDGLTALMWASVKGHLEIADILLKAGADVNTKGHDGRTALMWASVRGHPEIASMLSKKP